MSFGRIPMDPNSRRNRRAAKRNAMPTDNPQTDPAARPADQPEQLARPAGAEAYANAVPGELKSATAEYDARRAAEALAEQERAKALQTFDRQAVPEGEVVDIPLPLLQSLPNNPRTWTAEQLDKLVASLRDFPDMMRKRPLVVVTDPTNGLFTILGGNMKRAALARIGAKAAPCMIADSWTEEQRQAFVIKDNLHAGTWDLDLVARTWDPGILAGWGFDDAPTVNRERKTSTRTAKPYTAAHILISYPPELQDRVAAIIQQLRGTEGITIAQSAN